MNNTAKKLRVIYEPRGRAAEYAELAVNLFTGCRHGCRYCYAPGIMRKSLEDWRAEPRPRKDILKKIEHDAGILAAAGDEREILLCFMSDPYQSIEAAAVTRDALEILAACGLNATVLTKGGPLAMRDFDIMARAGFRFGSTIIYDDRLSNKWRDWEPGAPPPAERAAAVIKAHEMGIRTWVSVEPVIDTSEALAVIRKLHPWVDHWKVGKINHRPDIEKSVDWPQFLADVEELFAELGVTDYYIKEDLAKYGAVI